VTQGRVIAHPCTLVEAMVFGPERVVQASLRPSSGCPEYSWTISGQDQKVLRAIEHVGDVNDNPLMPSIRGAKVRTAPSRRLISISSSPTTPAASAT
jgi:hypothetical protein